MIDLSKCMYSLGNWFSSGFFVFVCSTEVLFYNLFLLQRNNQPVIFCKIKKSRELYCSSIEKISIVQISSNFVKPFSRKYRICFYKISLPIEMCGASP